jgi:hypothetical protein
VFQSSIGYSENYNKDGLCNGWIGNLMAQKSTHYVTPQTTAFPEPQTTQDAPIASLLPKPVASRSPNHQRFHNTQQRSKPSTKSRKSESHSNIEAVVFTGARVYDDFYVSIECVELKGCRSIEYSLNRPLTNSKDLGETLQFVGKLGSQGSS